ncbi:MAG: glycosyltransferase family 2 protein [Actinobacteria bacterium]|nr:glycosyltransferase family 2 protein [Actinomycetota bacterium]
MNGLGESELDVSVVLPVYNEAGHLTQEIKRIQAALERSPYTFEIIVVDDGSTDGSAEELGRMDGIRLIRFRSNQGTGTARKAGTRAAKGRVVVWTDVDMTYPNEEIPDLVSQLEGFDQVVGARTSERGGAKALRVPAKWTMRRLASYLVEKPIPDLNSGFRAFRRSVGEQFMPLLPKGFSCVSTMTMAFLINGYSVKYVPIEYLPRVGKSKFHWWRDTYRYLTQIVRMVMSYQPLRIFVPVGLALLTLGTGKLVFDLTVHPLRVATNTLLILFAALQLFTVGLLADLVVSATKRDYTVEPADS